LLPILAEEFTPDGNVTVVAGDILQVDLTALLASTDVAPWKVVANLPYYISSQVLFRFLDHRALFSRLVLMLQREVGERLAAAPGSKTYGALSVLCQLHFVIKSEFIVRPGAFHPPPKVDSVVVSFVPRGAPLADVGDEQVFRQTVKAAFSQRRKTLLNSLKSCLPLSGAQIQQALALAGIDGQRRAETLEVVEFATLSRFLCHGGSVNGVENL
jgi:16S rRNA (adenine1518-N6/adenine1519-N6)-dimethyltransferase